jgi:hypothetical protein
MDTGFQKWCLWINLNIFFWTDLKGEAVDYLALIWWCLWLTMEKVVVLDLFFWMVTVIGQFFYHITKKRARWFTWLEGSKGHCATFDESITNPASKTDEVHKNQPHWMGMLVWHNSRAQAPAPLVLLLISWEVLQPCCQFCCQLLQHKCGDQELTNFGAKHLAVIGHAIW